MDGIGASLRLRGRNLTETEHVKLGSYHTLELEPQRAFTLEKAAWDAIDVERIQQATDPAASADLAAVLITVSPLHMLKEAVRDGIDIKRIQQTTHLSASADLAAVHIAVKHLVISIRGAQGAIARSECREPLMRQPLRMAAGVVTVGSYVSIPHKMPPAALWQSLHLWPKPRCPRYDAALAMVHAGGT